MNLLFIKSKLFLIEFIKINSIYIAQNSSKTSENFESHDYKEFLSIGICHACILLVSRSCTATAELILN
jgi:hypothetical protein